MAKSRGCWARRMVLVGALASPLLACASGQDGSTPQGSSQNGELALSLQPVSGVNLNTINYVVTGSPAMPSASLPSGVIPTLGPGKALNFSLPVPVGHGYTVSLSAVAAELPQTITCTGSYGPFDVAPNRSTSFGATLTCVSAEAGSVGSVAQLMSDACPAILADFATAVPGVVNLGDHLSLHVAAHERDGKPLRYAWSLGAADAHTARISQAATADATLHCDGPGRGVPVKVTLSNGECSKDLSVLVTCWEGTCGNGILDAGETCDYAIAADQPGGSPAGTTFGCPQDCQVTCGDGFVEAPTEECELAQGVPTPSCSEQCRIRGECGDGFLEPGEQCDGTLVPTGTPACNICGQDCVMRPSRCGDGILSTQCGEQCEPPQANCNEACELAITHDVQCTDCEAAGACASFATACSTSPGTQTGEDRILCSAVEQCIVASNCADGASSWARCFCGMLSNQDCASAPETGLDAPHGACAAQIKAASGAGATNAQVLARSTSTSFPAGAAIARLDCLKSDPVCAPLCGF